MKRILLLGLGIATASAALAQLGRGPVYKPRHPDAPKVRVDSRVRGAGDTMLSLTVLSPQHVGLTTKAQPSLFWYQSKARRTRFELTITEGKKPKPVLEMQINQLPTDGIQRLRLADYQVSLKPDVEYRWSVAMVVDEENRSRDIVASGMIKLIEMPESLKKRLANAKDDDLPFAYADEGIWYDSLEALSDLIDKMPTRKELREERAAYFMQVGLNEAARHEMIAAGQTAPSPK